MTQKKRWLIDLLKLCKYHEHFNKDVLKDAWEIPEELAIEIIVSVAMTNKKERPFKFIKDTQEPLHPN
jgi:hypothetical protein